MSAEELAEAMKQSPRVISVIRLNAMPALLPVHAIKAEDEADDYTVAARATAVSLADGFVARVQEALAIRAASFPRSPHVEQQLFDGFPSEHDKRLRVAFHAADSAEQRANLALQFQDVRLRTYAKRLVHAETPQLLPAPVREFMDAWLTARLLTQDEAPWLTLHKACSELALLRPTLIDEDGSARSATGDEQTVLDRIEESRPSISASPQGCRRPEPVLACGPPLLRPCGAAEAFSNRIDEASSRSRDRAMAQNFGSTKILAMASTLS